MGRKVWAAVKKKIKKMFPKKRQEEAPNDDSKTDPKNNGIPSLNEVPEASKIGPNAPTKEETVRSPTSTLKSTRKNSSKLKKSKNGSKRENNTKAQTAVFVASNVIHQPGKKNYAKLNVSRNASAPSSRPLPPLNPRKQDLNNY
ncbi:unnamed protein product [Bursaphelenchus okinawaensis]|uniref:Uncharacterized protein n=1 Tax=Bursaphelenchus okinawaensis TaxID=465554 RepID=A0A811LUC1_9BILA|nr:unnamed protein product [Bursaphelenchus okinawaensis]CAG9127865.1 unnamed protein product [Bursaphelenchus okinawaensis]